MANIMASIGGRKDPAGPAHRRELQPRALSLATPARGILDGQTVTFGPGSLRLTVTATVSIDGQQWSNGLPISFERSNNTTATAIRALDGSLNFVDATFTTGEYTAVLDAQANVLQYGH